MKNKIFESVLISLVALSSIVLWWSVSELIRGGNLGDWMYPIVFFSVAFVLFLISAVLIKEKNIFLILILAMIVPSLFFAVSPIHLIFMLLAILSAWGAFWMVKREAKMILKVDIYRLVRIGRRLALLALVLIITSQYYNYVLSSGGKSEIPKIKLGKVESRIAAEIIARFNKNFKPENIETMSVDDFILGQMDQDGELSKVDANAFENVLPQGDLADMIQKDLILSQGKSKLSEILGREVNGSERILDVFSGIINKKLNDFFRFDMEFGYTSFTPWALSAIFFLMIYSLATFLSPFLIILAEIVFVILVRTRLIGIETVPAEREVVRI